MIVTPANHNLRASVAEWFAKRWRAVRPVRIERDTPWLTDGAVAFLDDLLCKDRSVRAIEFGCGASTIYLAQRVHYLVSFEHKRRWHAETRRRLRGQSHVTLRRYPLPYYRHIEELSDGAFGLALIDGRDRIECVRRLRAKMKPGGVLMVDNMERERYREIGRLLADWPRLDFEQVGKDRTGWNHASKRMHARWITSVWTKPESAP